MKVKDPIESCGGVQKEHEYLGHFKNSEHLSRGHNAESIKSPLDTDKFTVTKKYPFTEPDKEKQDPGYDQRLRDNAYDAAIKLFRSKSPDK